MPKIMKKGGVVVIDNKCFGFSNAVIQRGGTHDLVLARSLSEKRAQKSTLRGHTQLVNTKILITTGIEL